MMLEKMSVLFVVILLVAGLVGVVFGSGSDTGEQVVDGLEERLTSGSGTSDDPYMIYDVHDLQAMNENLAAHYALANDIDASETEGWNDGLGFEPVGGDYDNMFIGSLNGYNHTIYGLSINRLNTDCVGLLGFVGEGGEVRNVGVVDADVCGGEAVGALVGHTWTGLVSNSYATGNVTGYRNVGGLVGGNWQGTVSDSYTTINVSGETDVGGLVGDNNRGRVSNSYAIASVSGYGRVGGLVGDNRGTVSYSFVEGYVTGNEYVGGLVGRNGNTVSNSYATGNVSGYGSVGGLVGYNSDMVSNSYATVNVSGNIRVGGLMGYNGGSVSNSYAKGNVNRVFGSTNTEVGGFVGINDQSKVINCYSTGRVTYENTTNPVDKGFAGSVITGGNYEMSGNFWDVETSGQTSTVGNATGKTTHEMKTRNTFTNVSWDFTYTWGIDENVTYPLLLWQIGVGTPDYPFLIEDVYDLQNIRFNLCSYYVLANDIDASETSGWNDGSGFEPVGAWYNRFTGSFDGNNYNITGLYINRSSTDYVGLFGCVGYGGEVRNVGVVDVGVTGDWCVGGLVGGNYGTVSKSYTKGNVTGYRSVGGLIGRNEEGTVSDSFSTVDVIGDGNVGGLVGHNWAGQVLYSYTTGNVIGNSSVGGLIGTHRYGLIENSYTTGVVSGETDVGGLVGCNEGNVYDSYSTGYVTGYRSVGGLVGVKHSRTVNNSNATGNVTGSYSVGGLVGTLWAGRVKSSYSTGTVNGNKQVGGLVGFSGGAIENSYAAGSVTGYLEVGGLVGLSIWQDWILNSHYNISSVVINGGYHITTGGLFDEQYHDWITSGKNLDIADYSDTLVPIGDHYEISCVDGLRNLLGFAGNEGYKFRLGDDIDLSTQTDLYIPMISANFDGNDYTISNLHIDLSFASHLGLFGYAGRSSVITNVNLMNVSVRGYRFLGGLVGGNRGMVFDSYVRGNVNGNFSYLGGLIGYSYGEVINSCALVDVTGEEGVGGLIGGTFRGSKVFGSYATGTVSGTICVGGLVGINYWCTVSNSYAEGKVSGENGIGGLVGLNFHYGLVVSSYSAGNVDGVGDVGGLIGMNDGGMVSNTYATGDVCGGQTVGGLVGYNSITSVVLYSYAAGVVNGAGESVGGLIGSNDGTVSNSFWNIDTSGQSDSAGGIGKATEELINITTFFDVYWNIVGVLNSETRDTDYIWNIVDQETYPFFSWQDTVFVLYRELTITIEGEGTTEPEEGKHDYVFNTEVTITATPETGWRFSHWGGDVPEGEEENENITIVMDGDKTITAHFYEIYHNLTISVDGDGTTVPEEGDHSYAYGTEVNLTATPNEGWLFSHWTGDVPENESDELSITIVMDGDKNITAHFDRIYHNLTIVVEGEGTTLPEQGDHSYSYGTSVNLTATPNEGWYFSHWAGDVPANRSENTSVTLVMYGDKVITAHFHEIVYPTIDMIVPEYDSVYDSGDVDVEWTSEEGTYPIDRHEIRLNDGDWINVGIRNNHTFTVTEPGDHVVSVRVFDDAGNSVVESTKFTIEESSPGSYRWLLLLLIIVVVAIILVMNRGKGEESFDEEDTSETEEDAVGDEEV